MVGVSNVKVVKRMYDANLSGISREIFFGGGGSGAQIKTPMGRSKLPPLVHSPWHHKFLEEFF